MDTDSFIAYIKTDYIHKDIAKDVETRLTLQIMILKSYYQKERAKRLLKDKLGGKIMTELIGLKAKTYSYLIDNGSENKKAKGTKRCAVK